MCVNTFFFCSDLFSLVRSDVWCNTISITWIWTCVSVNVVYGAACGGVLAGTHVAGVWCVLVCLVCLVCVCVVCVSGVRFNEWICCTAALLVSHTDVQQLRDSQTLCRVNKSLHLSLSLYYCTYRYLLSLSFSSGPPAGPTLLLIFPCAATIPVPVSPSLPSPQHTHISLESSFSWVFQTSVSGI